MEIATYLERSYFSTTKSIHYLATATIFNCHVYNRVFPDFSYCPRGIPVIKQWSKHSRWLCLFMAVLIDILSLLSEIVQLTWKFYDLMSQLIIYLYIAKIKSLHYLILEIWKNLSIFKGNKAIEIRKISNIDLEIFMIWCQNLSFIFIMQKWSQFMLIFKPRILKKINNTLGRGPCFKKNKTNKKSQQSSVLGLRYWDINLFSNSWPKRFTQ